MHIKTKNFYKDTADDVEKGFDTWNYDDKFDRRLTKGKNKKVIGLMNNELGGKIMIEFAAPRPKTFSDLMNDGGSDEKVKGAIKCVIKRRLNPFPVGHFYVR